MNERLQMFLAELTELTRRYDVAITGCGCCGSPFTEDVSEDKLPDVMQDIRWDDDAKQYEIC